VNPTRILAAGAEFCAPAQMNVRPRVLLFVEGNTDIRFVTGLSEICTLTMAVPAIAFEESGLKERLKSSGANLQVDRIPGGRMRFQLSSFLYLLRRAQDFDLFLCQEVLRGAFNGTLVGALTHTPVITYMGISPVEYFRCRRERRQIGPLKAWAGESLIRSMMTFNGAFATKSLVMGPYLRDISIRYSRRTEMGLYYGVDTELYRPVEAAERISLRRKHDLPLDKFIVLLSSRISHEKDPETVLRATALARGKGLDAVVINLGGGYRDFLNLARQLVGTEADNWVIGRPAAHPMIDLPEYYQASDCLAQGSLAEGLGLSPLEALACGIPAVCTAVGGLAHLAEYARLTPRRDPAAMSRELLWMAANHEQAMAQAMRGREYVVRKWSREKAFAELAALFETTILHGRSASAKSA
jgi:glycosyltransferase involved in cell wall biosynthesis